MQEARANRRLELIRRVAELAALVVFGSLSEVYRTCGSPGCRCHGPGPKHGPHLQVVYRNESGKSTGYYVPVTAQADIRRGVEAWRELRAAIRELATLNRDEILERARSEKVAGHSKTPGSPPTARRSGLRQVARRS